MLNATLQDWVTIRGSGTTSVTQTASDWLDVEEFADAVFWLSVREVTNPGAGTVSIIYETSPIADESLFQMVAATVVTVGGPTMSKVMLTGGNYVPIARYVRWRIVGSTAGTWDATFRIEATFGMGAQGVFSPMKLPGLKLWLRADQGVTIGGGKVTGWNDLSGNANSAAQGTVANQPVFSATGLNGRPAIDFSGSTWFDNTTSNLVSAGSAYSVLIVAKTGNGEIFTIRRGTLYSGSGFFQSGTTVVYSDGGGVTSTTVPNTAAITQTGTTGFKSCHKYSGTGTLPAIYLNGVAQTVAGSNQTTENAATGFQIGNNASLLPWGGLIGEIIVCSGAIADADRLNVEAYQLNYWGL